MESGDVDEVEEGESTSGLELTKIETENPEDLEQGRRGTLSSDASSAGTSKLQKNASRAIQKGKSLISPSNKGPSVHSSALAENDEPGSSLSDKYLKTDPAFNPSEVAHGRMPNILGATRPSGMSKDRITGAVKHKATAMVHPKRAVMQRFEYKTAARLSRATRPYISPESDREFLEAHDALFRAESHRRDQRRETRARRATSSHQEEAPKEDTDELDEERIRTRDFCSIQRQEVEKLEAHRESLRVAWITGRHIKRVRLAPSHIIDYPRLEDECFLDKDTSGKVVRFKWERYIGHLLLYHSQVFTARYVDEGLGELQFDPETLAYYIERLVMATEPWQQWFTEMRRLCRWEDPRRTASWFFVFACLWYTEHIVGFFHVYVIFIVLRHRYFPSTVQSVRESLDRALDRSAQAYRWGELVDRHGREQWLEPLLDEVAPHIQLQVGDLADFFEILRNFYEWRYPHKTAATLFFFASCAALSLFAGTAFCMKVFWLVCILIFFIGWPVASRCPRYRLLVSPLRWVFWDIPTNPQSAIQYLQQHEILRREEVAEKDAHGTAAATRDTVFQEGSSDSADEFFDVSETWEQNPSLDEAEKYETCDMVPGESRNARKNVLSFRASHRGRLGYLLISSDGLRFVKTHPFTFNPKKHHPREVWSYPFARLIQMTKRHSSTASKTVRLSPSLEALEFEFLSKTIPAHTKNSAVDEDAVLDARLDHNIAVEILDMDRAERDEVFNLVIGRSKMRWKAFTAC